MENTITKHVEREKENRKQNRELAIKLQPQPGISTLQRPWNGFDWDAEIFKYRIITCFPKNKMKMNSSSFRI